MEFLDGIFCTTKNTANILNYSLSINPFQRINSNVQTSYYDRMDLCEIGNIKLNCGRA